MKQILPTDLKKIGRKFLPFEEYTKQIGWLKMSIEILRKFLLMLQNTKLSWGLSKKQPDTISIILLPVEI